MRLHTAPGGMKAGLLVEQLGSFIWVSTSLEQEARMMAEFEKYKGWWIGGIVREDPSQEHGFYFDPATIRLAEFTAEEGSNGLQTTIPAIKADLATHKDKMCFVAARFHEHKPLRPIPGQATTPFRRQGRP